MYPRSFFNLIPPFPRKPQAFVAMSFDGRHQHLWDTLFQPALASLRHGTADVMPFRVDLSKASNAILTEILEAIADSLVVVGELTALDTVDRRPIRNANVIYEVGLAHAVRLPEEVVLFRSDNLALDFDISGVRVHKYDSADDPERTRQFIADTVVESLKALDNRRRATLRVATESLTLPAVMALFMAVRDGELRHPLARTVGQAVGAVERSQAIALLLSLGAIRADVITVTPELLAELGQQPLNDPPLMVYRMTAFGDALMQSIASDMGAFDPTLRGQLESLIQADPLSASGQ